MADFDEHWGLGSTCHGKVLQQNRHGPLDRYYLAPNRYYLAPEEKANTIQIRPPTFPP